MSLDKERAHYVLTKRVLASKQMFKLLRKELEYHAQVFHLTITVPAGKAESEERRQEILKSGYAWKRRIAVEEAIDVIKQRGINLEPQDFVAFCEAVYAEADKKLTTLPPTPPPSKSSKKKPEGAAFYTKLLDGLRNMVRS